MTKKDFIKTYAIGGVVGALLIVTLFHFNAANASTKIYVYFAPFVIGIIIGILGANSILLGSAMRKLREEKSKAEKATRQKSIFLANMSHEIRTPLNSIIGFTQILMKTELSLQQRNALTPIHAASKSLLTILNDILDFSKIESESYEILYRPFNMKLFLEEIYLVYAQSCQKKGLGFQMDFPAWMPHAIYFDETRLRQIMMNLISNAIKFTHDGGVTVSILINSRSANTLDLAFLIADTGIGIADEEKENIFVPFSQTQGQNVKEYGGTGLGLAISMKLTSLLNGSLTLQDNRPNGTIFSLLFENISFEDHKEEALRDDSSLTFRNLNGKTLLLVDDIAANRLLIMMQLEASGCTVVEAVNGEEAVAFYHQHRPDIVLMDIRMPLKDGIQATREIRASVSRPCPIIAISADVLNKTEYEEALFDAYLSKPIDLRAFTRLLNTYS